MPSIFKNKGCLILGAIGIVVGVITCGIVIFLVSLSLGKTVNTTSENGNTNMDSSYGVIKDDQGKTYPCLMKPETATTKIANQKFQFVITSEPDPEWGAVRKDNGIRRLSLGEMANASSKNHLFYITYNPDGSYIQKNLTISYQVCDKNNNTIQSSYFEKLNVNPISSDPGDGNSLSSETEITSIFLPKEKGKYRFDGLAFYNGQWVLVTRIENIEFY
jgi:hypothetical protein